MIADSSIVDRQIISPRLRLDRHCLRIFVSGTCKRVTQTVEFFAIHPSIYTFADLSVHPPVYHIRIRLDFGINTTADYNERFTSRLQSIIPPTYRLIIIIVTGNVYCGRCLSHSNGHSAKPHRSSRTTQIDAIFVSTLPLYACSASAGRPLIARVSD